MTIDQTVALINRVLREYDVRVEAGYGVDAKALTQILSIEIFKEALKEAKAK